MSERAAKITQEEVNIAFKDLVKAGNLEPTYRDVLKSLGRGSLGTVYRLMQNTRAQHEAMTPPPDFKFPVSIQEAVIKEMILEVSSRTRKLEKELLEAKQLMDQFSQQQESFISTIEDQDTLIEELRSQNQKHLGVIQQLEKAKAEAQQQSLEAKEQSQREIDDAKTESEKLISAARMETDNIRKDAEHSRTELAKAQLRLESVPRLEREIDELKLKISEERENRHQAEQAKAVSDTRVEELKGYRADVDKLRSELSSVADQNHESQKKLSRYEAMLEASKDKDTELKRYRAEIDQLRQAYETLKMQQVESLRAQIEAGKK